MGSDESHFNVSLIVRDKVTRPCPQTTPFEEKGEPKRYRTKVLPLTSLPAVPLGQTNSTFVSWSDNGLSEDKSQRHTHVFARTCPCQKHVGTRLLATIKKKKEKRKEKDELRRRRKVRYSLHGQAALFTGGSPISRIHPATSTVKFEYPGHLTLGCTAT